MLTPEQAWEKIRKKNPGFTLNACLEYDGFYLFSIKPVNVSGTYYTGRTFPAVDKRSGQVFDYDITSDVDAYEKAKQVQIKTIMDQTL